MMNLRRNNYMSVLPYMMMNPMAMMAMASMNPMMAMSSYRMGMGWPYNASPYLGPGSLGAASRMFGLSMGPPVVGGNPFMAINPQNPQFGGYGYGPLGLGYGGRFPFPGSVMVNANDDPIFVQVSQQKKSVQSASSINEPVFLL